MQPNMASGANPMSGMLSPALSVEGDDGMKPMT
jgi:hypothetical protein